MAVTLDVIAIQVIWLILLVSADGMFLYKTDQNRLNGALQTFWLGGLQASKHSSPCHQIHRR